jgi:hypothetical protein
MLLTLQNGYPFPYPTDLTEAQGDEISSDAASHRVTLRGVTHFQWLHTVTVEFDGPLAFEAAKKLTGWADWGSDYPHVLEAKTSPEDGYAHPAIIIGDKAYCGFMLIADSPVAFGQRRRRVPA